MLLFRGSVNSVIHAVRMEERLVGYDRKLEEVVSRPLAEVLSLSTALWDSETSSV